MTIGPAQTTDPGELAARLRLATLFAAIDRLTPDELARIGYAPPAAEEREALLAAVEAAADRTGRAALVRAARDTAREAVLVRYSIGSLRPTFVGLNWGLSQGTVETRVAIADTLGDAAAAAVVEDALDPELAAAISAEAGAILQLAGGEAYEGSLDHVLHVPGDPELGPGRTMRGLRLAGVAVMVASVAMAALGALGVLIAAAGMGVRAMTGRARRP